MYKYYSDYYWKEGKPYGREAVDPSLTNFSYKIVVDPYFKRFSVEKYHFKQFDKVVYDSMLLDFRHLKLINQTAWQREMLKEEEHLSIFLLRNQDDRAILIETIHYEQQQCRWCQTHSIHGLALANHRMYYKNFNDSFDGVILFDLEDRPVLMKIYETDPQTREFTTLLSEEWNMQNLPEVLQTCQK